MDTSKLSDRRFRRPRSIAKKVTAEAIDYVGNGAVVLKSIGGYAPHTTFFLKLTVFEAVTLIFKGALSYENFLGNMGTIRSGDVQWMRVGNGIMHSEMPTEENTHGLQLWVNLPSNSKTTEPRYQNLCKSEVPETENNGIRVRVIAGEALGLEAPYRSITPTMVLDFTLQPDAALHKTTPASWNTMAYVIEGEVLFGTLDSFPVIAQNAAVFTLGYNLSGWNKSSTERLRFLLLRGQPLNEPLVHYCPFVMNTQAELTKPSRITGTKRMSSKEPSHGD